MKVTLIEGTPEEILSVMPHLKNAPAVITEKAEAQPSTEDRAKVGERSYVDTRVARKVLTRRRLKDKPLAVLKMIYKAHPKLVLATEIHEEIEYSPAQLAGLMGAFGRRLTHTEGYHSDDWFFITNWNEEEHCYEYGLPDSVRSALELEQLV